LHEGAQRAGGRRDIAIYAIAALALEETGARPLKICETFIGNVRASRRNGDLQIILSRPPLPTHLGGIAQTGNRPQGAATAEASRAQPVLGSNRL
jgi:hypothetical protein